MNNDDKDKIKHNFTVFHIKFINSPILFERENGEIVNIIQLPIDMKSILSQAEFGANHIKVRAIVNSRFMRVIELNKAETRDLLILMHKRFVYSKKNLSTAIKKLETLISPNQLNKLNKDFHEYYRPFLPEPKALNRATSIDKTPVDMPAQV